MVFVFLCFSVFLLAGRHVPCTECGNEMGWTWRHQDLLPVASRSLERLCRDGWRPRRRPQTSSSPSSRSSGCFLEQGQAWRWRVPDSSSCVPCWAGVSSCEEDFACEGWGRLGPMGWILHHGQTLPQHLWLLHQWQQLLHLWKGN